MLLAALLDLVDSLDGIDSLRPHFAVVFCWNVAALLEFEAWIDCEFFAGELAVNFGPLCLAWILLSVECFSALFAAESELLKVEIIFLLENSNKTKMFRKTYFAVVSHEQHAVTGVHFAGTEVARFNSHVCAGFMLLQSLDIEFNSEDGEENTWSEFIADLKRNFMATECLG